MDVMDRLRDIAQKVEGKIEKWFPRDIQPDVLARASRHLLEAGGKKFRPVLALISCEAVGGRAEDAIEAATALELLHTFTLIHDDIMDRDEFRRNVRTVHTIWGEPLAIIAGDALFAKVFEMVAANAKRLDLPKDLAIDLFNTVSKASFEICQGQALDMLFGGRDDVTEEEYLGMVRSKTGALIGASTRVGALIGRGEPSHIEALAEYGRLIGMAFQIRDDVLGAIGKREKFGKPIGSDIREGKHTLMVVRALKVASKEDRGVLLSALGKRDASEGEICMAIDVLRRTGAIDYANGRARELVASGKSKLELLRDSESKRLLLDLADFVVEREL